MQEEQRRTLIKTRQIVAEEGTAMFLLKNQLGGSVEECSAVATSMLAETSKTADGRVYVELGEAPKRLLRRSKKLLR